MVTMSAVTRRLGAVVWSGVSPRTLSMVFLNLMGFSPQLPGYPLIYPILSSWVHVGSIGTEDNIFL